MSAQEAFADCEFITALDGGRNRPIMRGAKA
jgi:hypothetical protein